MSTREGVEDDGRLVAELVYGDCRHLIACVALDHGVHACSAHARYPRCLLCIGTRQRKPGQGGSKTVRVPLDARIHGAQRRVALHVDIPKREVGQLDAHCHPFLSLSSPSF